LTGLAYDRKLGSGTQNVFVHHSSRSFIILSVYIERTGYLLVMIKLFIYQCNVWSGLKEM